jgi:hypothetical protein
MGGSHSDPTASEAQARIEGLDSQIVDVRSKLDERIRLVGECGELLMRMERELGACYADVIEAYYIDCADTWSEVAWDMGKHRDTVRMWRDAAFDWLDANSARYGMMM